MKGIAQIFTIAAVITGTAQADQNRGFFAGASVAYIGNDSLASEDDIDWPALELLGGYKFNGWLGVDVRVGTSTTERELPNQSSPGRTDYTIDNYQSIYYRPEITNKEAKLYGLFGYSQVDATIEQFDGNDNPIEETDYSESGLSYGLGAGWFIDEYFNVNIEYRTLLDSDEDEFVMWSLGFDYRFKF